MADKQKQFCDICHGIGFVSLNVPCNHKAFGRAQYCLCMKSDKRAQDLSRMLFWQAVSFKHESLKL